MSAPLPDWEQLSFDLQAILFHHGSVSRKKLIAALRITDETLIAVIARVNTSRGPFSIRQTADKYDLTTRPSYADLIRSIAKVKSVTLSPAALETAAIVAYKQPATKTQIDTIRGSDSESAISTLLKYGFLFGRRMGDEPGSPIYYTTTVKFLQHFGLRSLQDLPPFASIQRGDIPL